MTGTAPRVVRAALFTALVVLLSVASHVLLSHAPLPLTTVAAIGAAVFVIAWTQAGRARGFGRTAALLVPLELAADTVFTSGQHVCYGQAGGPVAGPLRALGLDMLCGGGPVGTPLARVTGGADRTAELLAHTSPAAPWLLLAAHVSVGLLATAWLRRGERALAEVLHAAAVSGFRPLLLATASVRALAPRPRRLPRPHLPAPFTRTRVPLHSVGRRGPPRTAVAFG